VIDPFWLADNSFRWRFGFGRDWVDGFFDGRLRLGAPHILGESGEFLLRELGQFGGTFGLFAGLLPDFLRGLEFDFGGVGGLFIGVRHPDAFARSQLCEAQGLGLG
jgi:hypothetical protein